MKKTIKVLFILSFLLIGISNICYADVVGPIIGDGYIDASPVILFVIGIIFIGLVIYAVCKIKDGENKEANLEEKNDK